MEYRALSLFKKKGTKESLGRQFIDLALMFNGVPYGWGKENLEEVDCSGLFSTSLLFMGFPIRETAEGFRQKFFTKETTFQFDPDKVKAIFFVSRDSYDTPSGTRIKGRARHIGLLVGNNVIFHAIRPYARFEELSKVIKRYDTSDIIIREIDWDKVKESKFEYSFDKELG